MTVWYADEGASPLSVVLKDYQSRDTMRAKGPVVLRTPGGQPLIEYALQMGDSSIPLTANALAGKTQTIDGRQVVEYTGTVSGHAVKFSYASPRSDSGRYLIHADVSVSSAAPHSALSITLPSTLVSMETDTVDDIRHLAYGYRTASGDVKSVAFSKLDSGVSKPVSGPLEWVALRNKYFLIALVVPDSAIAEATFSGAPRVQKLAPEAHAALSIPLQNGQASFEIYMGPQEFERLRAMGHGLDQVNPYAGWFHSVVQPFATIVTRVLLWMKRSSGLGYGWVIIIFGVVVRLLLWPLNQSAYPAGVGGSSEEVQERPEEAAGSIGEVIPSPWDDTVQPDDGVSPDDASDADSIRVVFRVFEHH
jgi:YidC/Oxa1 family membrane protein insertase